METAASVAGTKVFAVIGIVVILALGTITFLESRPVPTSGTEPRVTFSLSQDGATSSYGLGLFASVNTTSVRSGHSVAVTVDEVNKQDHPSNASSADSWALSGLSLGECGNSGLPFGIGMYQGFYTSANASGASPLDLFGPRSSGCQPIEQATSYLFAPASDLGNATGPCNHQCHSGPVRLTLVLAGYHQGATFVQFPSGVYTLAAGDEWGAIVILHFVVARTPSELQPNFNLGLQVSLNASSLLPGQAVNITAEVVNQDSQFANITAESHYPPGNFGESFGPCSFGPSGIVVLVFQGHLTSSNYTGPSALQMTNYSEIFLCPPTASVMSYGFEPNSSAALVSSCYASPCHTTVSYMRMTFEATVRGSWTVANQPAFQTFSPGSYTIVVGDEWGQLEFAYFTVG